MQQDDERQALQLDTVLLAFVDAQRDRGLAVAFARARGQVGTDARAEKGAIAAFHVLSFDAPAGHDLLLKLAGKFRLHLAATKPQELKRPILQRLRCGGRSVQTPSKSSAAMPTDSLVVGWGWMVLPMSVASAPISTASAISLIRSPAPSPTMPPPSRRWLSASKMSLVKPSSRALAIARPEADHGNLATPTLVPAFFASSSVSPT